MHLDCGGAENSIAAKHFAPYIIIIRRESVLYTIPASNIHHTELLNSKINKRIKTDKRKYTYTGTHTHKRASGRHEGMWSMQTSTNIHTAHH